MKSPIKISMMVIMITFSFPLISQAAPDTLQVSMNDTIFGCADNSLSVQFNAHGNHRFTI